MKGNEKIGTFTPDFLVAGSGHPMDACHVTVKAGEGKLTRGTALALNEGGKCVILGTKKSGSETGDPVAAYVLAEDVDATSEATAVAYRCGHFVANALIVKSEYTMTAADVEAFRKCGIFLDNGMK